MIAVRNWFPNGCGAPNGCDDATCAMCNDTESVFVEEFVRDDEKATRDGDPKLAAERERDNIAYRKRHREGANYVPRNARV